MKVRPPRRRPSASWCSRKTRCCRRRRRTSARAEHPGAGANADRFISRLLSLLHRHVLWRNLFAAIRIRQIRKRRRFENPLRIPWRSHLLIGGRDQPAHSPTMRGPTPSRPQVPARCQGRHEAPRLPNGRSRGAQQSQPTVKLQRHLSSLVLCGKQPSPALLNCVDASIAAQKNIVNSSRRQPHRDALSASQTCVVRSESDLSLATRATRKSFSAPQEIMRTAKRRHYGSTSDAATCVNISVTKPT